MSHEKITADHLNRVACVYIRQSSARQVTEHRESQKLQRSLAKRAIELGWPAELVMQVDADLGVSGSRSQRRIGFDDLIAQTALGKIGIILSLEVSRVSRGNRDWYHLLDVCGITHTLIADTEGIYDPVLYSDRMLLGLKGALSEGELFMMRQRMMGAIRSKAKRGEFRLRLPTGFVWDEAGRIKKVPDGQVVAALQLIFDRFEQLGTIHQTQASLAEEGVLVPVQTGGWGQVEWKPPGYGYLTGILKHPMYAGAYAFGRRQTVESLDASHLPIKKQRKVDRKDWHVLIKDHHEGFISWEVYERNVKRIADNSRASSGPGAPRAGGALLQGIVLCGRCGRRMSVEYRCAARLIGFRCARKQKQTGSSLCQSFGGVRLQRAVEEQVLECLEPLGMEAMLRASSRVSEDADMQRRYWNRKVERARYEVDLSRRSYEAVDPANRLVVRELERRYERALQTLATVEEEVKARIESLDIPLYTREKNLLRRYAKDIRQLWNASTTRHEDKKRIIRCLIKHVVVTVPEEGSKIKAEIQWNGGEVSIIEVPKGQTGRTEKVAAPELIELVRKLAKEFSDSQIVRILHCRRLRSPTGLPFTSQRVANLRNTHGIPPGPMVPRKGDNIFTALEAARLLDVDHATVIRWVEVGLLKGSQVTFGAPWRIQITEEDIRRLKATDAPKGWLPLKGAAHVLGVSQQTILQRLNSGKLKGVRIKVGRRYGWRICVPATSNNEQPSLFE